MISGLGMRLGIDLGGSKIEFDASTSIGIGTPGLPSWATGIVLDADVMVPGGGPSNLDRLYENVPRLGPRYVYSDRVDTRLARNVHGDPDTIR